LNYFRLMMVREVTDGLARFFYLLDFILGTPGLSDESCPGFAMEPAIVFTGAGHGIVFSSDSLWLGLSLPAGTWLWTRWHLLAPSPPGGAALYSK
jgi:hypothetical protein